MATPTRASAVTMARSRKRSVRDTGERGQVWVGVVVIEGRRLGGRHIPPSYQNFVVLGVVGVCVRGVVSLIGMDTSFRVVVVMLNPFCSSCCWRCWCCCCCSSMDRRRRHSSLLDFRSPANVLRPVCQERGW